MPQMSRISNKCRSCFCVPYSDLSDSVDRMLDISGASVTGLNNNDTQIARGKVDFCF